MNTRTLLLVAVALVGCDKQDSPDAAAQGQPAKAATAAPQRNEPVATPSPTPASATPTAAGGTASGCERAALPLDPSTVVAQVGDKSITAGELSPDAKAAEQKALHTYCTEIHRIRTAAVGRAVDDAVLGKAAADKGKDLDSFVREFVESKVTQPTDEQIQAYYDKFKSDSAPPLEQVKPQVVRAITEEQQKTAFAGLLSELKTGVEVKMNLPDVRPPALAIDVPEHAPKFGNAQASVQIVEFSDFECPYCARAAEMVKGVKEKYGEQVQFSFRHFPLSFHPNARPAAEYSQCAHEQDKFWPMHDEIFAKSKELSTEALRTAAQTAGLDMTQFDACLESGRAKQAVEADMAKAKEIGVGGTPTFYINGRQYEGNLTAEALGQAIEQELKQG